MTGFTVSGLSDFEFPSGQFQLSIGDRPTGERKQQSIYGVTVNCAQIKPSIMSPSTSSSSSSFASTAKSRLASLSSHIMGSTSASVFSTSVVPSAPEDPLFGLAQAYRQDPSDKKVDLVIGAYRDNNAKPWVLPVVKKVRDRVAILYGLANSYRGPPANTSSFSVASG